MIALAARRFGRLFFRIAEVGSRNCRSGVSPVCAVCFAFGIGSKSEITNPFQALTSRLAHIFESHLFEDRLQLRE